MSEPRFTYDPFRELGRAASWPLARARDKVSGAARATDVAIRGRRLTGGELVMVQAMFGANAGFAHVRVYPRNFWWPYPNDRAMTPAGSIYFPGTDYRDDFSLPSVPLTLRALFMHEATHAYQWYVLGQWVILRGPFDRKYDYVLKPGQPLKVYRLEQMGQIIQDYYIIRHGGTVPGVSYTVDEYRDAVPAGIR